MPTAPPLPADDRIDPSNSPLPAQYFTDRGENESGEEREVWMRADLHDYAIASRAEDSALADELGWTLQTIPWSVCVLGPSLPDGWAGFVAAVDQHVAAAALAVPYASRPDGPTSDVLEPMATDWTVPPTALNNGSLASLYELAERMFCGDATPRGDPNDHLPGWSAVRDSDIGFEEQVMPWWVHRADGAKNPDVGGTAALGAAYAAAAVAPTLIGWSAAVVRAIEGLECLTDRAWYEAVAHDSILPDHWVADHRYGAPFLESDEVNSAIALRVKAEALTLVGCPARGE